MKVSQVQKYSVSKHVELLQEYINNHCTIPAVTGKIFVELSTEHHKHMIDTLGMKFQTHCIKAIHEAVLSHYVTIAAKKRVTDDISLERKSVINSDDMSNEEIITKRISQEQVKLKIGLQEEKWQNLYIMIKEKLDISCTVSEKLFPVIQLNKINSKMMGEAIHFDCNVIGTAAQKLVVTKILTEKSGWINPVSFYEKRDGEKVDEQVADVQDILVEEILNKPQPGQVTRKITIKMYENFVGKFHGGDKLRVLGMYSSNFDDAEKHEKRTIISAINVKKFQEEQLVTLSDLELEKLESMASTDPEGYLETITESFVPNVLGNKMQKITILLCAIKSMKMDQDRDNIHVIFDDIPGTAKSDLLKGAVDFIQGSTYVDAPNATSRGLLYGQEDYEKTKILREGVMLRYNVVFLDEFDKIDSNERKAVNTAAQQQVAIYTKVPFHERKELDISIVAAANPKNEKWISSRSTMENLAPLEPSVLSRFIISKMQHLDDTDDFVDFKTNYEESKIKNQPQFTPKQIMGLVNHCKKINPKFTTAGRKILKDYLKSFKVIQESEDFDLPIDKRKEVDVIRVCSAIAKLLMKSTVDEFSVNYGVSLYKYTLSTIGMNTDTPTTQTQMTEHDLPKMSIFEMIFKELENERGDVSETELKSEMEKSGKWKSPHDIEKFVRTVHQESVIYEPHSGYYRRVS